MKKKTGSLEELGIGKNRLAEKKKIRFRRKEEMVESREMKIEEEENLITNKENR